jgi:hypothetical protein
MHIIFEKIKFKNFLSSGNVFTEIKLNKNKNTLIIGKNGFGKCLRGGTNIIIDFKDIKIKNKFKKFMEDKS